MSTLRIYLGAGQTFIVGDAVIRIRRAQKTPRKLGASPRWQVTLDVSAPRSMRIVAQPSPAEVAATEAIIEERDRS